MNTITALEEARARLALLTADMEARRAEILKPVSADLAELEAEYEPLLNAARLADEELTNLAKSEVVTLGKSVKGETLHLVYAAGRVSWDDKGLSGYAIDHPQILQFRKEGAPSVSIRNLK